MNCKDCGCSEFAFRKDGEMMVATCITCQHSFRFLGKKTKTKPTCPGCGGPCTQEKHEMTSEDIDKGTWHETYAICDKCGRVPYPWSLKEL